jgi:hypothetical protein
MQAHFVAKIQFLNLRVCGVLTTVIWEIKYFMKYCHALKLSCLKKVFSLRFALWRDTFAEKKKNEWLSVFMKTKAGSQHVKYLELHIDGRKSSYNFKIMPIITCLFKKKKIRRRISKCIIWAQFDACVSCNLPKRKALANVMFIM